MIYSQMVAEPTFDPRSPAGTWMLVIFAACALIINSTYTRGHGSHSPRALHTACRALFSLTVLHCVWHRYTAKLTETLSRRTVLYPADNLQDVLRVSTP
jgi:hypothetical protein